MKTLTIIIIKVFGLGEKFSQKIEPWHLLHGKSTESKEARDNKDEYVRW